jgi:hypothetical protein
MGEQLSDLGYHLNKQRDAWMAQTARLFNAVEAEIKSRADKRAEEIAVRSMELRDKYWHENVALKKLLRDILVEFIEELSANQELYDRVKASAEEITF